MIPKVIHYIWIGGNPLPKIAEKCIESWKKFCPDYEIKRWDETNLDINKYEFTKDAYEAKKFAFVSDVLRTEILYNEGGIYVDIDVEFLNKIDSLIEGYDCVMGFETSCMIAPGLIMASKAGNEDLAKILDVYKNTKFDAENLLNITVCEVFTGYYEKQGLKRENKTQQIGKSIFYASEYFSPKNLTDGKVNKTKNTVAIHHYLGSWVKKSTKFKNKVMQFIKRLLGPKIVNKLKEKKRIKNESSTSASK